MIDLLNEDIYEEEDDIDFEEGLIHCRENEDFPTLNNQTPSYSPNEITSLDLEQELEESIKSKDTPAFINELRVKVKPISDTDINSFIKKLTNRIQSQIGLESLKEQGLIYYKDGDYDNALYCLVFSAHYEKKTSELLLLIAQLYYEKGESTLNRIITSQSQENTLAEAKEYFDSAWKYIKKAEKFAFKSDKVINLKAKVIEKLQQCHKDEEDKQIHKIKVNE